MNLSSGTRIGPYEVVAPLGAGGMGEVYRARDTGLGRDVAVKVLPAAFGQDAERLARFRREAQTLASLNHPNIASIYGLEEVAGVPHLVLELVEGETLAARLTRGALPVRDALALCVQIAAAIEAAHERGVVHRDLKPGNVMITAAGVAKVLDFGLAKVDAAPFAGVDPSETPTLTAHVAETVAGAVLGTAPYMSPEQARGRPVDRRSDVWSFGCILFECLTGRPAFAGETVSDLIARILEREPDWTALPAGTPPKVREIARRCLRKNADERPRDIRDVRLELAEASAGGTKADAPREKSIAVLPFDNLSGADDEYFADGITDEILNVLAHLDGLRVAARTSCFAFKGRREDLRLVGEKLDVATVLEGTVRRSGARLRITVQLVNVADGYQLWSERYDREMTDVFEVQDEIANAIATRLRVSMHGDADPGTGRRGTTSLEAYEMVLKGRAFQLKRGRFLLQAIQCFERAIELDPNYAEALAWLADGYRLLGTFGVVPSSGVMARARALAERALAIDANLAEAWSTLADVEAQYDRDFPRAEQSWKKARAADPRHVRSRCERALWGFGHGAISEDEAIAETARAVADEPLNAWGLAMNSFMLGMAGRHEESIQVAERGLKADPESFFAQWNNVRAQADAGNYDRALELAPGLLAATGRQYWGLSLLAWIHARVGNEAGARAVYDEMEARSRHEYLSPFWLAVAADSAGLRDEAMRYVGRAVTERDSFILHARFIPLFSGIREDPRFLEVVQGVWV